MNHPTQPNIEQNSAGCSHGVPFGVQCYKCEEAHNRAWQQLNGEPCCEDRQEFGPGHHTEWCLTNETGKTIQPESREVFAVEEIPFDVALEVVRKEMIRGIDSRKAARITELRAELARLESEGKA